MIPLAALVITGVLDPSFSLIFAIDNINRHKPKQKPKTQEFKNTEQLQ